MDRRCVMKSPVHGVHGQVPDGTDFFVHSKGVRGRGCGRWMAFGDLKGNWRSVDLP